MTSEVRWRMAKRVVMMVRDEVNDAMPGSWYAYVLLGEGVTLAICSRCNFDGLRPEQTCSLHSLQSLTA